MTLSVKNGISNHPQRKGGFTLIEVMVAMAIGLFGVMVMTQVYISSEQNKSTSTSSGDAMIEGIVAMNLLQRDLRMGGFGIADGMLLGCNILLRPGITLVAMAPVTINHPKIPAGDANTDTIVVFYASTNGTPQGDVVTTQSNADQYSMRTISSFAPNDYVVVAPQVRNCPMVNVPPALPVTQALRLTRVDSIANPTVTITANTGVVLPISVLPSSVALNPSLPLDSTVVREPVPAPASHMIFNLGPALPTVVAYAVRNGNLTSCDYAVNDCSLAANVANTAVWVPVANNIVSLRAQYGHYAAAATATTVTGYDQTTPLTACQWLRTPSVRIALVARGAQPTVGATSAAPTWDGTTNAPINLTGLTDWTKYRYKVFQAAVSIRNIAWMGAVPGC